MTENEKIYDALRADTIALIDQLKSTTSAYGLANGGNEYKIIVEIFLYKFLNDKFGYILKQDPEYGPRFQDTDKSWDEVYDTFSDDEADDLFTYLPSNVPMLYPRQTLAHLVNSASQGDFSGILDGTLVEIATQNSDIFKVQTSAKTSINIFGKITEFVVDPSKRDNFAKALVKNIANFSFEKVFAQGYDFFSQIFEYLIKDYNNAGGGKYAEYYTPRAIAQIMAKLLVGEGTDIRGASCYDPSAGTGTLLIALGHQIGDSKCSLYSQDISDKSSEMLRLNFILNGHVESLPNVVQGNTLTEPAHRESDGTIKKFDFIVSNPPFKLDFPEYSDSLATQTARFWAGIPNKPSKVDPGKPKMEIYTCFIQHLIYSLKEDSGRGAIVIPTGFITSKSGIKKKILEKIVDEKIVYGCVSMPSNVFATTGTNVSVLFFDKSRSHDRVILIDASKLGEEYQEGNNKKVRLRDNEIDLIVNTFHKCESVDDFSVAVTYEQIKEKGYSLSAGQYFEIKIDHQDITADDFNARMSDYKKTLSTQFAQSKELETEIMKQLENLFIAE